MRNAVARSAIANSVELAWYPDMALSADVAKWSPTALPRLFGCNPQQLMQSSEVYARYQDLQAYVSWTDDDARRVRAIGPLVKEAFGPLIDDFYQEIDRHPGARKVFTGGEEQIARLKGSLRTWLEELFAGTYDEAYVERRSKVGRRHVEIGLEQIYTNAALSRLRKELVRVLAIQWNGSSNELHLATESLHRLIDLDLAIIEYTYQSEYFRRQQQSDRLAAIGQVAGGIAHELRNPLNVVKTSIYFLLNAKQVTPAKLTDHLQRIERQVGVADDVITALSDFARLPVPLMQRMSIEECLHEVLEVTALPETIAVQWALPPALPPLLGDAGQLKIVFSNVIRNARDAMPSGGKLTISAAQTDVGRVLITIADTGIGIKPEDLERIMEPLYSTKARGIGLGLAITRAIVEKHDGRMRVTSELGVGTQFMVTLPTAGEETTSIKGH